VVLIGGARCGGAVGADPDVVFYAPFDGDAGALLAGGASAAPTSVRGLEFVEGVCGQAVYIGKFGDRKHETAPLLEYDGAGLFASPDGTVSFWVRPDWDGHFTDPKRFDWHYLFAALGGKDEPDFATTFVKPGSGYGRIGLFMWNWLRYDLAQGEGEKSVQLQWRCRNTWMRGDWWHVAFSWDSRGRGKLYVNGTPQWREAKVAIADIQRFYVGGPARTWVHYARANAAIDELRIRRRALADHEVMAEFRRFAPLDFALERRFLRADTEERVEIEIEPADPVAAPVTGVLTTRVIADADGRVLARDRTELRLARRRTIVLPLRAPAVGDLRAECVYTGANGRFQRSFPITVYRQRPAPPASDRDVELGERIVSIDCTTETNGFVASAAGAAIRDVPGVGRYREAGEAKWDRFAFEVALPAGLRAPVALEVAWPDDRERAMALYMIVKSEHRQHRDRLSGGIQCGGEYPLSRTMRTTRYLFYPESDQYLFEVRTLIPGLPAAVARLEIFRLDERLPKLAVRRPEGAPQRAFGHLDEDQSFEINLGGGIESPTRYGYAVELFERLLDYLDYTGQNTMSYALLRYDWGHLDMGPVNAVGSRMRCAGWVSLLLDMMQRRGLQLVGNVHLFTVPERPVVPRAATDPDELERRVREGRFTIDRTGKVRTDFGRKRGVGNNPAHPAVRGQFLGMVAEIARRFGRHPAFAGMDLWIDANTPLAFRSPDVGYGDFTVALFEKETGLRVPAPADDPGRFEQRARFLNGPGRDKWLAWRARKTTELVREVDAILTKARPDLRLHLTVGGWHERSPRFLDKEECEGFDFRTFAYERLSVDLEAVKQFKSVVLTPMKDGTIYRWLKHWTGGRENVACELNWSVDKFRAFRHGARSAASVYLRYFESFSDSLKPDVYKGYFQNDDPKAHGRYFLKDFAIALAAQDAAQIFVGAQPLGTAGRDVEVREFAKAYRALPAGEFQDVPGLTDPVTARWLNTPQGTYLYVASLVEFPLTVQVDLPEGAGPAGDLSSGRPLALTGTSLPVELTPFQLRSFLVPGPDVRPRGGRCAIPPEARQRYAAEVADLARAVAELEKHGADATRHKQRLSVIERELAAGAYAEARRLIASKLMRGIPELRESAAKGYLSEQAAMIRRSEYALNCGAQRFYRAKSGRLFFPEHQFQPGGYGYDGGYSSVGRPVAGLKGTPDPVLFAREAYNIDAYRFTVAPGAYTVRLHLKVGYRHNAKPGTFVFDVLIEGRPVLTEYDVFTGAGGDFFQAAVREFKGVAVADGVLDIEWRLPATMTIDPTARLCNAIEIIPEK